jgi:hypothetical protein
MKLQILMLKLLREPEEIVRMSEQAWAESQQYSVEAYARTLENLYIDLVARSGYSKTNAKRRLA